jgi:L-aspartate oxidase
MQMQTDFLVIGSGIAGLTFAIDASAYGKVTVITKKDTAETNTNYAQGGIAAAVSMSDSIELHLEDTVAAGDGLCKPDVVKLMAAEAPSVIDELVELGVDFSKVNNGEFDLGREGGHSKRRIIHTKDATGKAIEETLIETARKKGVELVENWTAVDLILKDKRCIGSWVMAQDKISPFFAPCTLLAAGGVGNVYLHTTNPAIATGDGIAMAYRAGSPIANMEFVQFHPTAFYGKKIGGRAFLLSESVRGEGAVLRRKDGSTFMEKYDSRRELAPRDVVARAIHSELKKSGDEHALLDATHLPEHKFKDRFPTIYEACCSLGVNPAQQPIPVVPAAHYECGGVVVDIDGRTGVEGLFAVGETACTGVHGANRLASNSLLESIVFAHRAADAARIERDSAGDIPIHEEHDSRYDREALVACDESEAAVVARYLPRVKELMWQKAGIRRDDRELGEANKVFSTYKNEIEELQRTRKPSAIAIEARNAITVAWLIVQCALNRKESRGLHYNSDHPDKDDLHYRKDTII